MKINKKNNLKNRKNRLLGKLSFSRLSKPAKILVILIIILVFSGIGTALKSFSEAAIPNGTYSWYRWSGPPAGFNAIQHELTVEMLDGDPTYYWAHQVFFINGGPAYTGIQSHGNSVSGKIGKTAVFSIFDSAVSGTTGNCHVIDKDFDGYSGRKGTSCRIPYDWVLGRKYQFTMRLEGTNNLGRYWSGYVRDTVTGADTLIGNINIPSNWQGLSNQSVQWTEYFGAQPATCNALPLSRVRFSFPRTYLPPSSPINKPSNNLADVAGACTNSQVETGDDSVVQQMGGYTQSATAKSPAPSTSVPTTAPAPSPTK